MKEKAKQNQNMFSGQEKPESGKVKNYTKQTQTKASQGSDTESEKVDIKTRSIF